jgi:hypothetical protein
VHTYGSEFNALLARIVIWGEKSSSNEIMRVEVIEYRVIVLLQDISKLSKLLKVWREND